MRVSEGSEIIPTRQVKTRSKLFCIDRLISFGFIWYQLSQSYGVSDFLLSKSYQGMLSIAERYILKLPSWRERIMTMRILVTNFSIRSMDNKFGFLVARDTSCNLDCLCLGFGSCCSAGIAFTFYLPSTVGVRSYMLILSFWHKITLSKKKRMKPPTSFKSCYFRLFTGMQNAFKPYWLA